MARRNVRGPVRWSPDGIDAASLAGRGRDPGIDRTAVVAAAGSPAAAAGRRRVFARALSRADQPLAAGAAGALRGRGKRRGAGARARAVHRRIAAPGLAAAAATGTGAAPGAGGRRWLRPRRAAPASDIDILVLVPTGRALDEAERTPGRDAGDLPLGHRPRSRAQRAHHRRVRRGKRRRRRRDDHAARGAPAGRLAGTVRARCASRSGPTMSGPRTGSSKPRCRSSASATSRPTTPPTTSSPTSRPAPAACATSRPSAGWPSATSARRPSTNW